MRLQLKTKITLTTSLLVLVVVAVISAVYVAGHTREVIAQADKRAQFVAQQIFLQAQHALEDAADEGSGPASNSPDDLREYVRQTLDENRGLTAQIEASVGYSPSVYEVTIADHRGVALISSDDTLPGRQLLRRPRMAELSQAGFTSQLKILFYDEARVYEVGYPFNLGEHPFGDVRVAVSSTFLRSELGPGLRQVAWLALSAVLVSTLFAAGLVNALLAPLKKISAQLDRIAKGEFEAAPVAAGDELGQVSTKISKIGEQLRGVRQIFSTLRENIDQVLAGLDDGLILFSGDHRAVLVSPSVEKFLARTPQELLGKRPSEVFPLGHPLHAALRMEGDTLHAVEAAQVRWDGAGSPGANVSASVHVIEEHGERMGALVTLRDLASLERLGTHLQASEQLSALSRVTAGVAHEVKNPLNSMRLWLENLKQSLSLEPVALSGKPGMAEQAVQILDSEIDRLDRVVKTFLDFTRPVEPQFAETDLVALLRETSAIMRPEAERAGVDLAELLPPKPVVVRADGQLLKQALLNLAFNALQAMRRDARPESAHARRLTLVLERRAGSAEICVADTGPGIPPEHRGKVFQLFFTTRKGGSGIGLATAYRIVQLHSGTIDYETQSGRGTTFRILLPLAQASAELVPAPAAVHTGATQP
jgi:signal transduction histidine kinase